MMSFDDRDVSSTHYAKSKHGSILSESRRTDVEPRYHLPTATMQEPSRKPDRFGAGAYRTINGLLGFRESYSLLLLFIFGGALAGFCLARSFMMNPVNVRTQTKAGEWFWYSKPLFKPNIFLHIYMTILGGIFAILQFLPVIRRRAVIIHRINGYFVLILVIGGTVCGSIVARHAFGGELNVQSGFWVWGSLICFAAIMGYINVKHTTKHRKWMLRCVAYLGAAITIRFVLLPARQIITLIGTYYAVWRCDELVFALHDNDAVRRSYPQCDPDLPLSALSKIHLLVLASNRGDPINVASTVRLTFGMAIWIALLIHVIGIEFYLRKSESKNAVRLHGEFVLGPMEKDEDSA